MKIYRVEHKDTGIGPYNQSWGTEDNSGAFDFTSASYRLSAAHGDDFYCHPSAHSDIPGLHWSDDFRSCFTSMRELFAWFGGWLPVILRDDFHIVVMDVPASKVLRGSYQAAYVIGKQDDL